MGFETFATGCGWVGLVLMLVAYYHLSKKNISSSSKSYNLLNLFGGILVLVNSIFVKAWAIAVLNIFWSGVAFFALIKSNKKGARK